MSFCSLAIHIYTVYPSLIVYHSLQSLPYRPTSTSTLSVCFVVLQRLSCASLINQFYRFQRPLSSSAGEPINTGVCRAVAEVAAAAIGLPPVSSIQFLPDAVSIPLALLFDSPGPRLFNATMVEMNEITQILSPHPRIVTIQENLKKRRPVTPRQRESEPSGFSQVSSPLF